MSDTTRLSVDLGEGGTMPCYMTRHAACADMFLPRDVTVPPHVTVKVPLNVSFDMSRGQHIEMFPRSSLLVKRGLMSPVSIIDTDYKGNVHVVLHNLTDSPVELKAGERVCQIKVVEDQPRVLDWTRLDDERNQEGFGGTGL